MSVTDPTTLDCLGIDNLTGEAVLTISDHLDWSVPLDHMAVLQQKLNAYLAFIESGEVYKSFPSARGRPLLISVVAKHATPPEAEPFFANVRGVLQGTGVGFRVQTPE